MNKWLTTIAIPTYNRLSTLRTALASVLRQHYEPLRVIVCDNASDDGTAAYCRDIAKDDARVIIFRHPANFGAASNFRSGLEQAEGEFFMWLGDDDWLDPTYIRDCVRELCSAPDAILAAGSVDYYDGARRVMRDPPLTLMDSTADRRVTRYFNQVGYNGSIYGVYRLDRIRDIRLGEQFGDDWRFIAEVVARGPIVGCLSTTIHRSLDGVSRNVKALGKRTGVPQMFHEVPHAWLAWRVFRQIAGGDGTFGRMQSFRRMSLAIRSGGIIVNRFCKPGWYPHASHEQLSRWLKATRSVR